MLERKLLMLRWNCRCELCCWWILNKLKVLQKVSQFNLVFVVQCK